MKKLITLLLLAATTLAFGAEKIEVDLFGCTLGTPKGKVQQILKDNEVLAVSEDEVLGIYTGSISFCGINWNMLTTLYMEDSLIMVAVIDSIDLLTKQPKAIKHIQEMYADLPDAVDFPLLAGMFDDVYKSANTKWARSDGNFVILYAENKDVALLLFVDYSKTVNALANVAKNDSSIRSQIPDYQESNRVTGVAGFKFGDTKASVEAKAKSKWGVKGGDEHSSIYYNVTIGGVKYDALTLYYRYDDTKKDNVLIAADLQKHFSTYNYNEAVESFNNIRSLYSNKYTNEHFFEDDDVKTAMYGMLTPEYQDEKMPPITITMRKSLSNGGAFFYYVTVSYYIYNINSLYDDEI